MNDKIRLLRENGQIYLVQNNEVESDKICVRVVYAKPWTFDEQSTIEIALMDKKKKKLVQWIDNIDHLDIESQTILSEELKHRRIVPLITKVLETKAHFGVNYWKVETDKGKVNFAMKNNQDSIRNLSDDRYLLKDTVGNFFEIKNLSLLDSNSQKWVERMI